MRWIYASALLLLGCAGGGVPEGWRETPSVGDGPVVRWELEAEPLPEIPLPNDIATWPDPTSPSGRRINASVIAPSAMETRLREEFNRLDGWGTFSPLTVGFDASLDLEDLVERQGRGRWNADDFARHAIYLIDLETGVPVPLDIDSDRFPLVVADPQGYFSNDPRRNEPNLLFDTVDEDENGNGLLDAGEDSDFDGVLDEPNTLNGEMGDGPFDAIDTVISFYERETDTLILRPVVPLLPQRRYAVVLTDRLRGEGTGAVRSPLPHVHHVAQTDALATLPELFGGKPHIYGDLATRGWEGVAFAWSFTTQSTRADLVSIREGLYGRGPFARLAEEYPPRLTLSPLRGGSRSDPCDPGSRVFTITPSELREALDGLPVDGLGLPAELLDSVLDTLERSVSHMALGFYESPYLLGDPDAESVYDTWDIDRLTGDARISRDIVPMFIVVPKETENHAQPFQTTLYAHGYGSLNLEALAFAGLVANHGVATVSIDAQGHGLPLGDDLLTLLESVLGGSCLAPLGRAISLDRARDLNRDGTADSAGLFFSAYMFHTRDTLRQSTVDWLQAVRILRSFADDPRYPDGREWEPGEIDAPGRGGPLRFEGDVDADGVPDSVGDLDGNGVPDLGGYDAEYGQWGSSLGGILSMINAGVEPAIRVAAPVSGGGGLFDIGLRSELGTARNPIWLRVLGPIIASRTSDGPSQSTSCAEGDRSIFFEAPDLNERRRLEIGCLEAGALEEGDVVQLTNLTNGEVRCSGVRSGGRFRVTAPMSEGDRIQLVVYRGVASELDFGTCDFGEVEPPSTALIDRWSSANGSEGEPGACPSCATYQGVNFELDSPLTAPFEGLGLQRMSPELRRLSGLGQLAVDPADPVNYARHVFLDPATAEDVPTRSRSVMVMATAGDTTVPVATSYAYARAAGVLAFLPPGAPEELADYRAPARVGETWGWDTPDDVVIETHALEGLSRLHRHPASDAAPQFLFDVDDLSDGRQFFATSGRRQLAEADGGVRPQRLDPPLRWGRESRRSEDARGDPWRTDSSTFEGTSVVLNAMTIPTGQHVLLPTDPRKVFDEGQYLLNVIGWYIASGGRELPWNVLEDPFCLERNECVRR